MLFVGLWRNMRKPLSWCTSCACVTALRFAVFGIMLWGVFEFCNWNLLQVFLRDSIVSLFGWVGMRVDGFEINGEPGLQLGAARCYIDARCTYVDLVLAVLPFLWSLRKTAAENAYTISLCVMFILVANYLRVCGCFVLLNSGVPWRYAHDLPDHLIWYPTLFGAVLYAALEDRRCAIESRRKTMVSVL